MRGSGDFLTDFLKNDIEELNGLVYDEETDAMFVHICKGICSIKESDPIPSSIKLSGDFSIDLIVDDEVQKVDDAVYNEKTEVTFLGKCKIKCDVKALEPASNNEIKSKIAATRRKLKEGYKRHWRGSKKMIPLNFKDLPKPKGRGVHRDPTMLVDIHKNICDIEESHSTPSATKQSSNLLMDFLEDEEVQEVYDAVYNEETEAIFLGICKTICDVKAPEPASNSQIESKIEASRRKLKEGYKNHKKGRRMTKLLDFKDLPKPEELGVRRKHTMLNDKDLPKPRGRSIHKEQTMPKDKDLPKPKGQGVRRKHTTLDDKDLPKPEGRSDHRKCIVLDNKDLPKQEGWGGRRKRTKCE
ncbi:hypothetical protein Ancab_037394 [Ancistrocladus abbreviatus]